MKMQNEEKKTLPALWFPFTREEVGVGLGSIGFLLTILNFVGISNYIRLFVVLLFVVTAYGAGLLVYSRREGQKFQFIRDGGINGLGYRPSFQLTKESLLLTHVDDDSPNETLNELYRSLLNKGVKMRRLVFLREGAPAEAYAWIAEFGDHPNLSHRVVPPDASQAMRFSFVVVDEKRVIVSVPGYETLDARTYNNRFILRHIFVIKDEEAAKVFSRMHADLWTSAIAVPDVSRFKDPQALMESLKLQRRGARNTRAEITANGGNRTGGANGSQ
jgi:hypothetical protein